MHRGGDAYLHRRQRGFGALGHGINDMDTSTLMELRKGTLYHTDIIGVKKGSQAVRES